MLTARMVDGRLVAHGVSDLHKAVPIEVRLRTLDLSGQWLDERRCKAQLPPDRAIELFSLPAEGGTDRIYVLDGRRGDDFDPALQVVVFPAPPKRFELPVATDTGAADGPGRFVLASDAPAFYVRPEAEGRPGHYDDASFLLLPGEDRVVTFRPEPGTIMPEAAALTIPHLRASYL